MKKIPIKTQLYFIKRNKKTLEKIRFRAIIRKIKNKCRKKISRDATFLLLRKAKTKFQRKFYKKIKYNHSPLFVEVNEHFGIEEDFDNFLRISASFIDSQSKWVFFNLDRCIRIWPSAVTLLCSFKQWTEVTAKKEFIPKISSTKPKDKYVDAYLLHCGFYEYVNVKDEFRDIDKGLYDDSEIVKIKREKNKTEIENREDAIRSILEKYSSLTSDQVESFDCNVLIEAFNNVTEHGRSYRDNGWWTLTQYHKRTGIISLCIADNGIGIKNSLLTGPQSNEIRKRINNDNDGEYISLALNENVSGAMTASIKEEKGKINPFNKYYLKGSRRGNGLKRIKETCHNCGIEFNILSQKGYLSIDSQGKIKKSGTYNSRIFAGTLYHFVIPAKILLEIEDYGKN